MMEEMDSRFEMNDFKSVQMICAGCRMPHEGSANPLLSGNMCGRESKKVGGKVRIYEGDGLWAVGKETVGSSALLPNAVREGANETWFGKVLGLEYLTVEKETVTGEMGRHRQPVGTGVRTKDGR